MPQPEAARVAYIVKRYPRYSETFIVNEILAHEAAGFDVEIFALRASDDTHFQDIISRVRAPVTYLPDRIHKVTDFWSLLNRSAAVCPAIWSELAHVGAVDARSIGHAAALAAMLTERGIGHIHAHFATSATSVALLASRFTGIPFSFTAHAKDIFHETVDQRTLGEKVEAASAVVTVSDFNVRHLSAAFPHYANKIHRIYNGLDLQRFPSASATERKPLIVSVGRLVEKKGFDDLIRACALLRERDLDFSCLIIGSGELEEELRQLVADLALEDYVELAGPRPQREVIDIVQSAAAFAAPCVVGDDGNRDGLPTVLLEAMALGTPCVGTNVTGIPEALIDGRTGICIEQRDVAALADALQELLGDPHLRVSLASAARRHVEALFDVERNAAAVRALFTHSSDSARRRSA